MSILRRRGRWCTLQLGPISLTSAAARQAGASAFLLLRLVSALPPVQLVPGSRRRTPRESRHLSPPSPPRRGFFILATEAGLPAQQPQEMSRAWSPRSPVRLLALPFLPQRVRTGGRAGKLGGMEDVKLRKSVALFFISTLQQELSSRIISCQITKLMERGKVE
ncbi:unnamed protein product [Urochloa humidicola]